MYSAAHDPRQWVLPAVIEEQAMRHGDRTFATVVGGASISYRELRDNARQVAGMLHGLGVARGARVALMLPSGLDFVRAWAGIGRLGAITVFLNTELRGTFLAHPLIDSQPDILVIDATFLPAFDAIRDTLPFLRHLIVVDGARALPTGQLPFEAWQSAAPIEAPMPRPSDLACIMYTSGTTGAPKGVLMPHGHCFLFGLGVVEHLAVNPNDHYYVCLPLAHANGMLMQLGAVLIAGAQATVRPRFSASSWLADIRDCGATLTNTLGAISAFVIAQARGPCDREHKIRAVLTAPNHPDHDRAWRERFGIADVVGGYGMTEVNIPLYGRIGEARPGTCGRPWDKYFEVDIHDPDTDFPVARGDVGEIMVRPRMAHGFMAGYVGQPAKTVEAWRNLWFHTGDAGKMDQDGYIIFVDRIKDCIRRRGENISATDIEAAFTNLPGVAEIAAFAVPSGIDGGEDEIMLALVRQPGSSLSADKVASHAAECLPRFAQPRYLDFVDSLPKTASEKVRKTELKETGVSTKTLDLQALDRHQL